MFARPAHRFALASFAIAAVALGGVTPLPAQYFGRNKVQYEAFQFQVLKTEHFDIYFYPAEQDAARQVGRMAERWYARFTRLLNHPLRGRQPVIIYASHPEFEQTNAIAGALGEGTGGVTEVLKRRIVLPLAGSLAQTDHVLGHELVHAFQYDITGEGLGVNFRVPGAARLPLWFIEGMAEYLSIGPVDPNTAMWLRDAAERHKLPTIRDLYDSGRYFPYRYGQAFWAFIAGRWGDASVGEILRRAGRAGNTELALQAITGLRTDSLSKLWRHEIEASYDPLRLVTSAPTTYGKRLIGGAGTGRAGRDRPGLNVAPAVSPDGTQMVFFAQRDLFSIDLYLGDPRTGQVERRVIQTALDPHYQSLEFINSAGAWDPSGRRIAFGAVTGGKAVLSILDVRADRVEREIPLADVGEVFNPTWSPDGRAIVFSALAGGFTDLFRYDLTANSLDRLTNDSYADFEPVWSPDGRTIAFVTDRFSTKLDNLAYGDYELALMDAGTGRIERLAAFSGAKNINPQWAPDGRSLYFVSDQNGISNVYRIEVASGRIFQVTNLYTGTSGITDLSPALSVAQGAGTLVYGVYEASGFSLYALDSTAALAGGAVREPLATASPAVLPPPSRISADLVKALRDPDTGLPSEGTFAVQPYRSRMSLDYVSQPSIAVGADRFGTFVGGGIAMFFSDMLGNHNLVAAAQINGGFKDASALLGYENDAHRWNWGVAAQQIPYYSGAYGIGTAIVQGQQAVVEQVALFRQTNRQLALMTSYPINTAARVEFSGGVSNVGFDSQVETQATSLSTGNILYDSVITLPAPSDINVATASAAFVYDNSFFGATSPVLGQRFRLEAAPAAGTISWVTLIADYRRYFMLVRPFTLAVRALHFGRYGSGAEDERLTPLYLGYPSLVRGYDIGSFSVRECPASGATACPAFDRLLGSQLFVGNLELRFPLLGALGLGQGYYGALPIEAALFADGGLARCPGNHPTFCVGDNQAVYSTGAALRVNVLGYAVAEIDFVKPFQRPDKGWYLELSLTPGF
jgi:Tol biopolymer transport system component